ncbi:DUF7344 domain-containing protein [Haladaptatus halobius]|uniref:DUF7344 domain-containing protein n=1 Tax=Haladaptatus halobius TaxID=2884875 RepID=UPI001D0B019A|nr:hypothetical protein [Haladaptatus halobius]
MLSKQLAVLSSVHRRQLLVALAQSNPQHDQTSASGASETTSDEHDQAIAMQHVHLPVLADHGFIDWEQETQTVTKGPQFDEIEPLLTAVGEHQEVLSDGGVPD